MTPERKAELRGFAGSGWRQGPLALARALGEALDALEASDATANFYRAHAEFEHERRTRAEGGWHAEFLERLARERGDVPDPFGPDVPAPTREDVPVQPDPRFKRNEVIEDLFTYHAPTESQKAAYEDIRESAKRLACVIDAHCAPGPDRTTAIRKLREAVMTANASIATNNAQYR